jgi:TetR/AcrR family transcriptional repressor of nem operon
MRAVKQLRAVATRDRIIAEAAQLFALKGYHDTKLEEVLKVAQVTTGAFFHHFASKEDLGFAVIDRHMIQRRRRLDEIERRMAPSSDLLPLDRVSRRLDAIQKMVRQRHGGRGGCIIGNLSTALSDTHEAFRTRLSECFDEMAREFKPHLDEAAKEMPSQRRVNTSELARYIVAVIEGSIMLTRTQQQRRMMARHFTLLKEHLARTFAAD